MELGKQIRVMREARGIRQKAMAKKLGQSDQGLLGYIERGQMLPSPSLLARIKAALDWPEPKVAELMFAIYEGTVTSESELMDWLEGKQIVRIPFADPEAIEG